MKKTALIGFICCLLLISTQASGQTAAEKKQAAFEWVFGNYAQFDREMTQKVLADTHGKRHYVDRDGDGKPEEVWFIDTDPRHNKNRQPLLVRVIDEDGDLTIGGEPDLDSDLYLADWNADGTIDAVVDYEDVDGDQDVDRMSMFFYTEQHGLRVWWGRDDGDDNLLWYDIDYYYYQNPCQNHTHFGGDETFFAFYIKPGEKYWTPFFENPFLFYDLDGDGITEEVLRVSGQDDVVHSIRWSFDLDNDATIASPRDFDVSMSAYAPGLEVGNTAAGWSAGTHKEVGNTLRIGDRQSEVITIRGIDTRPVLKRTEATSFFSDVTWSKVLMTWDENDLNKDGNSQRPDLERWEGIIAAPSTEEGLEFPVIGGPDCGPFNKRYQIVMQPSQPNEFYFNPSEGRLHISHSDKTWLKVDFDYDNKEDMYYLWTDTDNDGILDKVEVDINGDGKFDDSWQLNTTGIKTVRWNFEELHSAYTPVILDLPKQLYALNEVLTNALESIKPGSGEDEVWKMIENKMQHESLTQSLSERLVNSDESMLYYLRIAADRRIFNLKKAYKKKVFWKQMDMERGKGELATMVQFIREEFKLQNNLPDYTAWIANLRAIPDKKGVAWDNTWFPPNWGWESEKAAFRCYDGHFDLFAKRMDTLIYPAIGQGSSYHKDTNGWGMDILHVGKTGGIGGLVLYVDGVAYPVRNEKNPGDPVLTGRLVKETTDSITLEFIAENVGPKENPYTLYIRPSAIAGRKDSPVEVVVEGGKPGQILTIGLTLTVLPTETFFCDKESGIMGSWGFQDPEIGWIGIGLIFPESRYLFLDKQPEEHRVVLRYNQGESLWYHIQGDWLRAHQFPRSPGAQEWKNTLKKASLNNPVIK
ncbi:DUF4861 family protein [Proteiniphilum sp.]|uniref:DUF4861 family protein n=1 Tax=Proteiniphilum sp. TaxID=1926877 RepID=UPI002B2147D5|nr:DUF4861 family protein [Proteiniphilum sp.]MEA4917082.1 DUF4861 family protein [Proteiniphilum sp.]